MIKLKHQDKVALISTSSYYGNEQEMQDLQAFLQAALRCEVIYSEETYKKTSAKERAANFLSLAMDPSVTVMWAIRGGEGSSDLLPFLHLQLDLLRPLPPKFLIGFSDVTPLLVFFLQQLNWYSIHGIGARQLLVTNSGIPLTDESFDALRDLLLGGRTTPITQITALNDLAKKDRLIKAPIIGGNLSLLNISIKDCWQPVTKNKIVLLEEVNEPAYRIARTIKYLQRVGFFHEALAILFAGLYFEPEETAAHKNFNLGIRDFLQEFAAHCELPVLYTPQISHNSVNLPAPLYLPAELHLGSMPEVLFLPKG